MVMVKVVTVRDGEHEVAAESLTVVEGGALCVYTKVGPGEPPRVAGKRRARGTVKRERERPAVLTHLFAAGEWRCVVPVVATATPEHVLEAQWQQAEPVPA